MPALRIARGKNAIQCMLLLALAALLGSCDQMRGIILPQMPGRILALFEADSGRAAQDTLVPGKNYVLALNTKGLRTVGNEIMLYYRHDGSQYECLLAVCRWDPRSPAQTMVSVANTPDDLRIWPLRIPDQPLYQEYGVLKLLLRYQKNGAGPDLNLIQYYTLADSTPDQAFPLNEGPPLVILDINIGYLGNRKSGTQVGYMLKRIQDAFRFAAKGYAEMNVHLLDWKALPANDEEVGGRVHDYLAWWQGLSHDVSGTDLLPLTGKNPADLEMIRLAWYASHSQQLHQDIEALFNLPLPARTLIIAEVPAQPGSESNSNSPWALVPLYNDNRFSQEVSGVRRYGRHRDFGFADPDQIQRLALQTIGRMLGMPEAQDEFFPAADSWQVRIAAGCLSRHGEVVHLGLPPDYPTDLFFTDAAIAALVRPNVITAAAMEIPYIHPAGDPIGAAQWTVSGSKQPGCAVLINGGKVAAADPNTYWSAAVPLIKGENRLDIAQLQGNLASHPCLLYLRREHTDASILLSLELKRMMPAQNRTHLGKRIEFEMEASAAAGIQTVRWWVEKASDTGVFTMLPGSGHERALHGAARARLAYTAVFAEPGQYKIKAIARDMAHPAAGAGHQSLPIEILMDID
ncbi:hypothetical protein JW933_07305 [candidate division FCPU426 bacterium]|nr:hypothetical protein [candidate division FCPU426 bacterium]